MLDEVQQEIRNLRPSSLQELNRRTREVESLGSVLGDVTRSADNTEGEDVDDMSGLSPETRRRALRLSARTQAALTRLRRATGSRRTDGDSINQPSSRYFSSNFFISLNLWQINYSF